MIKQFLKHIITWLAPLLLFGCAGFFNKDNTPKPAPLQPFTATITPHRLWASGTPSSPRRDTLRLDPTLHHNTIYTAGENGMVSAIDKHNGNIKWITNTLSQLSSGPGVGKGIIVIGTHQGEVVALEEKDGERLWRTTLPGEVLAKPIVLEHAVIVKATDGVLRALDLTNGQVIWTFNQTEPSLILREASMPLFKNGALFVGFANGNLAKINAETGQMNWRRPVAMPEGAFSIERMVDIDASPITYGYRIFAATYQGKIAALDEENGNLVWSQDLSSYTGIATNKRLVYATDAGGVVSAFDIDIGNETWKQTALTARRLTAPVLMGHYLVVGDREGYLHWLNQQDGRLVGRVFLGDAILATPIVENNVLYALTRNGLLAAYTLN